jgi:hypothetical protein
MRGESRNKHPDFIILLISSWHQPWPNPKANQRAKGACWCNPQRPISWGTEPDGEQGGRDVKKADNILNTTRTSLNKWNLLAHICENTRTKLEAGTHIMCLTCCNLQAPYTGRVFHLLQSGPSLSHSITRGSIYSFSVFHWLWVAWCDLINYSVKKRCYKEIRTNKHIWWPGLCCLVLQPFWFFCTWFFQV